MSRLGNVDFSGSPPPRRSFGRRLLGAITLDATVYEEVEQYPDALGQAAGVVLRAALARGVGELGEGAFLGGVLAGLLSWLLGTAILWVIGVAILRLTSDFPELLRTLGFATAPQILYALHLIPAGSFEPLISLGVFGLGLVAWVIAVRQALDVSTLWSVAVCAIALLPNLAMALALDMLLFWV